MERNSWKFTRSNSRTPFTDILTNWFRVTHICVGNLTIIGSDIGLSPHRHQAIICFQFNRKSNIFIQEMHLKMSSAKWRLDLNVLTEIKAWISSHHIWNIFTQPCSNFNCNLTKPPLNLWHRWVITFSVDMITNPCINFSPSAFSAEGLLSSPASVRLSIRLSVCLFPSSLLTRDLISVSLSNKSTKRAGCL